MLIQSFSTSTALMHSVLPQQKVIRKWSKYYSWEQRRMGEICTTTVEQRCTTRHGKGKLKWSNSCWKHKRTLRIPILMDERLSIWQRGMGILQLFAFC